jgi:hypothetical protein
MRHLPLMLLLAWAPALQAESPRTTNLEIRLGSYSPDLDREFGDADKQPYADVFGHSVFPMFQLAMDWEFLQGYGTAGAGASLGYGSVTGKGRLSDGSEASDTTGLHLMPFTLGLMYEMDYAAERWNVPLVPFGRFDFVYTIWWFTDGSGSVTSHTAADGTRSQGYGGTWGFRYGGGLKLLLDVFAPDMAHSFDVDFGVNNTYLVAEITWYRVDDFGSSSSISLGADRALSFGLGFEF